ncbi:MAG: GNAT family N-acetyltransferase [Huintestinicola sp.]
MSLIIRKAEDKDASLIISGLKKLAEFEKLTEFCKITEERLLELMHEENGLHAAVAELNGETAGIMTYYFFKIATFSGMRVLYVEDIWVEESFRRQGIGRAFLMHAKETAEKSGCSRVEWKCLDWNENARRLYDSVGRLSSEEWLTYTIDL